MDNNKTQMLFTEDDITYRPLQKSSNSAYTPKITDESDTMDMIEVDPELFVKCRLCLEDTGMYQIVPVVQEQIKFCFDIEVNLFDGLPQLICKKCKSILSDYFATKTTYIEKQNKLKTEFEVKTVTVTESTNPQQLGTVTSSQEESNEIKEFSKTKKRRTHFISTSATSDEGDGKRTSSPILVVKKKNNVSYTKSSPGEWDKNYRKKIVCIMCHKRFRKKSSFVRHFTKHGNLVSRYHNIFKTYCTVNLNKTDDKPNMTGMSSTVVYSPNKIISNEGKMNYYVVYTPKHSTDSQKNTSDRCENAKKSKGHRAYSDSSDNGLFVKQRRKRPRLLSRSSNETVVLEGEKNESPISSDDENRYVGKELKEAQSNNTECINIVDSSDSASCNSNMDSRKSYKPIKVKISELKQIQSISSVCHSKYLKRKESENVPSKYSGSTESQLKHKILNMGRKVITKQGFNCTGLLRYVENKILEIIWIPTNSSTVNANKETNYVRIMPKLRGNIQHLTDNLGWKFITGNENSSEEPNIEALDENISEDKINPIANTVNMASPIDSSSGPLNEHLNESKILVVGHMKENQTLVVKAVDQAVLYTMNADMDVSLKNKLLNASPVANPKQLPKKSVITDSKANVKGDGVALQTTKQNDVEKNELCVYLNAETNSDKVLCMPIITSTTSLAAYSGNGKQEKDNINKDVNNSIDTNGSEKCTPRIKVKPVSELMPQRVLKNLSQQQVTATSNIWGINNNANVTLPYENTVNHEYPTITASQSLVNGVPLNTIATVSVPSSSIMSTTQVPPASQTVDREYVILDTAEFPNTKTDSPFKYFKNLLLVHNIILLDTNERISRDFVCLIKFKLQYKQETVDQPVILYLSFLCATNKFYLGVKYSGQENNIDLNKLPANWQWEILNKIYQDEVVNKVLKNAEKINQSVYENTNSFLCLLKSIKFKRDI